MKSIILILSFLCVLCVQAQAQEQTLTTQQYDSLQLERIIENMDLHYTDYSIGIKASGVSMFCYLISYGSIFLNDKKDLVIIFGVAGVISGIVSVVTIIRSHRHFSKERNKIDRKKN